MAGPHARSREGRQAGLAMGTARKAAGKAGTLAGLRGPRGTCSHLGRSGKLSWATWEAARPGFRPSCLQAHPDCWAAQLGHAESTAWMQLKAGNLAGLQRPCGRGKPGRQMESSSSSYSRQVDEMRKGGVESFSGPFLNHN
ncbi:hypothetical protein E2320_008437 [Naja naja]|nr:hypothetical protein E2320_008437 [Naja naja]